MTTSKTKTISLIVVMISLCLSPIAALSQDRALTEVAAESKGSVALLTGYNNGRSVTGTGFLLNNRVLITNAHVVDGVSYLVAEFSGGHKSECKLISSNRELDLAALALNNPVRGHAIQKSTERPQQGQRVILIGHPLGLTWSVHEGSIAAHRTLGEIAMALGAARPRNANQRAIQLNITSTQGMSGAPVLDQKGELVGIQKDGWKDGLGGINFCIPSEYLNDINMNHNDARPFPGGVSLSSNFNAVGVQGVNPQAMTAKIGNRQVDIGCRHWGFVPRNVDFVFNQYIGDKVRFSGIMPRNAVQLIVGNNPIVNVVNPSYGFAFLLPNSFNLTQTIQKNGRRIKVNLANRDPRIPQNVENGFQLHAWKIDRPNHREISAKIIQLTEDYVTQTLGLRVLPMNPPFNPNYTKRDVVPVPGLTDFQPRVSPNVPVARFHYTLKTTDKINQWHNIYVGIAGDTCVIGSYQYSTRVQPQHMLRNNAERQFIGETISFSDWAQIEAF